MSTNMRSSGCIGLVETDDVARPLRQAGFEVVTADWFRDTVVEIRRRVDEGTLSAVIVPDVSQPGLRAWTEEIAGLVPTAILATVPSGKVSAAAARKYALPCPLWQIVSDLGLTVPDFPSPTVTADGGIDNFAPSGIEPATEIQQPDWDRWSSGKSALESAAPTTPEAPAVQPAASPGIWLPKPPRQPGRVLSPASEDDGLLAGDDGNSDEIVDSLISNSTPTASGQYGHQAPVIVSWAGKGGVGKSSYAIALAQRAALAGVRVVLVDANRGQPGVGVRLRISRAGGATVYDAAVTGDPKRAFLSPDQINAIRPANTEPIRFALVQAPPAELADRSVVTNSVYRQVIDVARNSADLVVIDSQIMDAAAHEPDSLNGEVLAPLMTDGAWSVGITTPDREGTSALADRLREFNASGMSKDKSMVVINQWNPDDANPDDVGHRKYGQFATYMGVVFSNDRIFTAFNSGQTSADINTFAPMLDGILLRVTGMHDRFGRRVPAQSDTAPRTKKRGLFSSLLSGAKRDRKAR